MNLVKRETAVGHLYVNSQGFEVNRHSYSGGDTFQFCPKKYELQRVRGWRERGRKASLEFGKAIENAIQRYHSSDLSGALLKFNEEWLRWQHEPISYTSTEGCWDDLSLSGQELLQLYHLRLPFMPFVARGAKFQTMFSKDVFPGTALAGIEFVAYVDVIAELKSLLPATGNLNGPGPYRHKQIVIDIKTSGTMLDTTPGIHALDQQLRAYAWITGIPDVAFLVLVKTDRSIGRGSWVSLLQGVSIGNTEYNAGNQAIVVKTEGELDDKAWIVKPETNLDDMKLFVGDKPQSKDGKSRKQTWLEQNATLVPISILTKQRVQFLQAHIDAEAQQEAASQVGEDIAMIVRANETNTWKKQGGTRYPNNKCTSCCMRGICLKDDKLRDELIERDDSMEFDFAIEELNG